MSLSMPYIYIRMSRTYVPIYYTRVWNLGFQMAGHVVMPRSENARENTNTLIWRGNLLKSYTISVLSRYDANSVFLREKGLG
jgi:hypothetical protein